MTLQEKFEKETGENIESDNQWPINQHYIEWLEKEYIELETKLNKIYELVDDDTLAKADI